MIGRKPDSPRVLSVRAMTRDDLEYLRQPSHRPPAIKRIRDSHHMLARMIATGMTQTEAAARTGYSTTRVTIMMQDPTFKELVEKYRAEVHAAWRENTDAFFEYSTANMVKAERMLADRLEDAEENEEPLPVRELIAITADRADRFGYPKKAVNTNFNIDFAAKLEKAIARSKQIE